MSENPRRTMINKIVNSQPSPSQHATPVPPQMYKAHHKASTWWEANWAINVFTDQQLKKRIPKSVYKAFKACVKNYKKLDDMVADVIANAMKDWASERGATHYTHWFQPIHIPTAEKHDSFLNFQDSGRTILEFSGAELIRGEPDASSFPNGGIRSTYEARGYTSWDPSSPAFLREGPNGVTLCIPTVFCSWTGEALDVKTPLLRSIDALNQNATALLKIMGDTEVQSVHATLGPEQEFFLVDRNFVVSRPDLLLSGRALFGAKPAKGQEMEDHYFGRIHPRVLAYIQEVEQELWRLGVPTKTRHNEVAPGQHEMAPIFEECNLAADHNSIAMEVMKEIALKHNLECLLHEKPFAGVNGSGKHNNWSMCTDYGLNLLEPSKRPEDNIVFQVFLTACIRAVDLHADLLRASIVTPGNDFRLGANEAPPAIMSVYLGSEIGDLVKNLLATFEPSPQQPRPTLEKKSSTLTLAHNVAPFRRDRTDRNRTSPFAFTGNKFEFRAVGSSQNVGGSCMILNVIVADAIRYLADEISKKILAKSSKEEAVTSVVAETLLKHKRVLFDGNGYSQEWVVEAEKRGLPNLRENIAALEQFASPKNVELFKSLGVLAPNEVTSRRNIYFEHYCNSINIEGQVAQNLAATHIIPSTIVYQEKLANSIKAAKEFVKPELLAPQEQLLNQLVGHINGLLSANTQLEAKLKEAKTLHGDLNVSARFYRDQVKVAIEEVRKHADALETVVADELWTLPKYIDMLFIK